MRHFGVLALLLSTALGAGAAFAQQPAARLMAVDAAGNIGGDLDEPSGVPDTVLTLDISGVESWGLLGNPDNTILTECLGDGALMSGIGWDVIFTTIGNSWLNHFMTYFDASDQDGMGLFLSVGNGDPMPGTMSYSSGGIIDLTDNGIPNIEILDDDTLYIEFFESADDIPDAPDGVYEDGSTYDLAVINFGATACGADPLFDIDVPTLNTAGLIALVVLLVGLGMLFLRRQLRDHQP